MSASAARELLLAVLLLAAAALVVRGVALWSVPAAWVVGGVLLAALGVFFLAAAEGPTNRPGER